jgi:hypothetical protein
LNPIQKLFNTIRARLTTVVENDTTFNLGVVPLNSTPRDRLPADRYEVLVQSIEAWRVNPLARRIVGLISQYVVGGGIEFTSKHTAASKFLHQFWNHRLNHIPIRVYEWCDELTRTGNLFIMLTTDLAGMSYVRAIPATAIKEIHSRTNDVEQPLFFELQPTLDDTDPKPVMAYDASNDDPAEGSPVILHYAINRPVGAQWGESDLAPLLRWLSRYANWLEDRARLNHFRSAFMYVVKGRFTSDAARSERQRQLNAQPPTPGSILVCDESETWDVISPSLEASDANSDGLALKKMICSGAGIPMHFLAEPEGSNRTTAEAAGGPTFRHFEQRQEYFLWMLSDILGIVLARRSMFDHRLPRSVEFQVTGNDISTRDNAAMSMAANNIVSAFGQVRDHNLIDDAELLRLLYRFSGETIDVEDMLERAKAAQTPNPPYSGGGKNPNTPGAAPGEVSPKSNDKYINPETGDTKGVASTIPLPAEGPLAGRGEVR